MLQLTIYVSTHIPASQECQGDSCQKRCKAGDIIATAGKNKSVDSMHNRQHCK